MKTVIDVKSGKSMPWSAIQLAAYTLLDAPINFEEEGHLYTDAQGNRYPSVTGILKSEGFIDTTFYNDYGRERGSFVHLAINLDLAGELDEDSLDPVIVPYLASWRDFLKRSGFIVEQSEVTMVSTVYQYAGTPDIIGRWPNGGPSRAVVELNNGKYRLIPHTDRNDVDLWRSILSIFRWKGNNLK